MWVGWEKSCVSDLNLGQAWAGTSKSLEVPRGDPSPEEVTSTLAVRDEKHTRLDSDLIIFQGWLSFDGSRVSMQYSAPRDQRYEQPKQLNDWTCAKVFSDLFSLSFN